MAKTNPSYTIDTMFSGKDITSAFSVYQFTSSVSQIVQFIFKITNVSGAGGDYVVYLKRQWGGVGATSTVYGKSTFPVDAGDTDIEFDTMEINVKTGDVVDVMVLGLAGETSVNGNIRIVSDNPSVLEQSDILSDSTPFAGANVANVDIVLSTVPALVWAVGTRTLTSFGTLVADIWAYVRRTLTMSQEEILAIQTGSDIAVLRGDTLSVPITGLGNLTDADKLYVTVRKVKSVGDDESSIQVEKTAKLLYLNGASPVLPLVNTDADLVVNDATDGDITFSMKAVASTELRANSYYYDVQKITSAGATTTMRIGSWTIAQDVTRTVT